MRRRHNAQPALLLATECTPRFVAEALAAHCSGVVLTSAPRWVIAEAVVRVAKGLRYIYPSFSEHELRPAEQSELRPISTLSAREREVFELLVHDDSNLNAAKKLVVSVKTIETHRTHIFGKLKVHSIAELMRFAIRHGLLIQDRVTEHEAPEALNCPSG
jgi:two-component system response regulator NreC